LWCYHWNMTIAVTEHRIPPNHGPAGPVQDGPAQAGHQPDRQRIGHELCGLIQASPPAWAGDWKAVVLHCNGDAGKIAVFATAAQPPSREDQNAERDRVKALLEQPARERGLPGAPTIVLRVRPSSSDAEPSQPGSPQTNVRYSSRYVSSQLWQDALQTLPSEVVLLHLRRYRMVFKQSDAECLVLDLHIPPGSEREVVVRSRRGHHQVRRQLASWFGEEAFLDQSALPRIRKMLDLFNGQPPTLSGILHQKGRPEPQTAGFSLEELCSQRGCSFPRLSEDVCLLALDPDGGEDHEDAFAAHRIDEDHIHVTRAIVDLSWLIDPGSYADEYARALGASLYNGSRVIPAVGPELAFGLGSFVPGEDRVAWISECIVSRDGQRFPQGAPRRAIVKLALALDRQGTNAYLENGAGEKAGLLALREAAIWMNRTSLRGPRLERFFGPTAADLIVLRHMTALNQDIAAFLGDNGIPAIFKVRGPLTSQLRSYFVDRLGPLGIPAKAEDFDDDAHKFGILAALQQRAYPAEAALPSTAAAVTLADKLIDSHFGQSRFDTDCRCESEPGSPVSTVIKPRDYAGLLNSQQLHAYETGSPALSREEVAARARDRNRQRAATGWMRYRLRMLEMLERKLQRVGMGFNASVAESTAEIVSLDVPGFSRGGVLDLPPGGSQPQGPLWVVLRGFSMADMRFHFG
jgi:hypothetical protein